ncbi:hypothetical protein BGZ96_009918 [Linnemannia gamsii]|uniref:Uncharacterized protein n=1 Tax=Linnemannia gamsii TaxID=64522 RepID=A0ABQ7JVU3_9FUNG|nr:hypothetical protein BGZ96_009918 [Linnemannia gamsii]
MGCRQAKKRAQHGPPRPETWEEGEKGLHQARHQQQSHSGWPSPTLSFYGGNGYGHSDAYYQQYDNNNNSLRDSNGLYNNNSISRGPQNLHPERMDEDMRSVNVHPPTLPNDTAVYWPPLPGLPQGLSSSSPPPPPFSSLVTPVPPVSAESSASASASALLKRSARNPQDHQRQEQLEYLLMQQRRQMRELQELQQQHQRENPLSGVSAPHAPTQEDRQIWHNSDRVQRQQWLQQQQPYHPGGNSRGGIIVSGPVGAIRDPQDWGVVDDGPHRQDQRGIAMQEGVNAEEGEDGQQNLRAYIAQMKAEYEEQFRKHQEELERLKTEQETQLQMLREQIKE